MPEEMTSAGWVLVGWGAACGSMITALVCLSHHWWYRLRTHVTVAGAAEQRINRVRDKAAIRSLRTSLATACRPVVARTAIEVAAVYGSVRPPVSPPCGPAQRAWTLLDQQSATAVPPLNDGYPPDVREAAAASQVRAQTRVFADGDESPKAGRHRFEELSGDTQQIDGDRIKRVLGVAS